MKKIILLAVVAVLATVLSSCTNTPEPVAYTDDAPIEIAMERDTLKILQLTDLHLTYGIDAQDRATLALIETLVKADDFDLVVITGDMVLSNIGPSLFRRLIRTMEGLEVPWTFVFGNHETDHSSYQEYLAGIGDTTWLRFKVGPELEEGGVGNFAIRFTKDGVPFYHLYFFDSHAEREVYTEEEGEYDYVRASQVAWYEGQVADDTTGSVAYMHMPLRQFIDSEGYVGIFDEDKVYAQGVDTGLFDAMAAAGKTKGVFVGHDHLNDFYVVHEGIMLAYGRISGFNAYGNLERGGRVVAIDAAGAMTSYVLLESEAGA
ncbi:MAG: metallophosphoesterase [Candidatus Izemoplasmatales bacterium]